MSSSTAGSSPAPVGEGARARLARVSGGRHLLTIAVLTLREATRRRLVVALALLTLLAIALTGWGFSQLGRLEDRGIRLDPLELELIASQLLVLVMFMFSFIVAFSAVFLAAPAIAGDLDSGIALALLARPVRRRDLLLGRWLGLAVLVSVYAIAVTALELLVTDLATGYLPSRPLVTAGYMVAGAVTVMTFALLLSTRLSTMTAGVVALLSFAIAWVGGIVGGIGSAFNDSAVRAVGAVTSLLLPTDGLWRAANHSLEPATVIAGIQSAGPNAAAFPFFVAAGPSPAYLVWCALWLLAALGLAILSFERREV